MNENQKATDFVAVWIEAHRAELGGANHTSTWREQHSRMLCAEFETPRYLIQLCSWDHGCCLDTQALNNETGRGDYIVAGGCDGVAGLEERLDAFLRWLHINELNRDA